MLCILSLKWLPCIRVKSCTQNSIVHRGRDVMRSKENDAIKNKYLHCRAKVQ